MVGEYWISKVTLFASELRTRPWSDSPVLSLIGAIGAALALSEEWTDRPSRFRGFAAIAALTHRSTMANIHPSALVDPAARVAADATIGPYSIIGAGVVIGAGTVVGPHVVVTGHTTVGMRNRIFQFASIGDIPQDRKYGGEPTTTTIGDDNVFREYASIHAGTRSRSAHRRGGTPIRPHRRCR